MQNNIQDTSETSLQYSGYTLNMLASYIKIWFYTSLVTVK